MIIESCCSSDDDESFLIKSLNSKNIFDVDSFATYFIQKSLERLVQKFWFVNIPMIINSAFFNNYHFL